MNLRLCGDLHGDSQKINKLLQSCHNYDLTIQLGDFGAGFGAEKYLDNVSSDIFRVLHGNHDDPSILARYPHNLGRFGIFEIGKKKIFFIAGAKSIDIESRTPGYDWWPNEELSFQECDECLTLWEENCKEIDMVISHDGPIPCTQLILKTAPFNTFTGRLLWEIWKIHKPPMWYFGHYHKPFKKKIQSTMFQCLDINETIVLSF